MARLVDLTLILIHETPAALLLADTEDSEGVWVPKSVCEIGEPLRHTKQGYPIHEVTMPEHTATQKGLL
jgi:hypothetical protein